MSQTHQDEQAVQNDDRNEASRSRSASPASKAGKDRSRSRSASPRRGSSDRRSLSRSASPDIERSPEPGRPHGRGKSHSRSPSPEAKRQRRSRSRSETTDRIAEAPVQPSATDTIRIDNFVRPLRIDDVRELASKYGNVQSLTMDKFKTHAIVKFDSRTEAAEAFRNLQGLNFQPEGGKTLSVSYVSDETIVEDSGSNSGGSSVKVPAVELGNGIPPPATNTVTLDHLFKKTVALPPLYWLPKKV